MTSRTEPNTMPARDEKEQNAKEIRPKLTRAEVPERGAAEGHLTQCIYTYCTVLLTEDEPCLLHARVLHL